jgi:hypothetical protein
MATESAGCRDELASLLVCRARFVELAKRRRPGGLQLWTFVSNVRAQRFYRRHGFTVEERTAGSSNEEKAPDLRYVLATVSARGLDGVPLAGQAYAHQGRPRAG